MKTVYDINGTCFVPISTGSVLELLRLLINIYLALVKSIVFR